MIVQSAPNGRGEGPQFVIKQYEHQALCGQFIRAFGNDEFAPPDPVDEIVYAISYHDQGWFDTDNDPGLDPKTRLPYNVLNTSRSILFKTSSNSPDFNQRHHPYSGLISSMHSWGLYNGRYGLSDKILVDNIEPEYRPELQVMLDGELKRQERLKGLLAASPNTAPWIQEDKLFTNYKLLQFIDTLALYFNLNHEDSRTEATYVNVPRGVGDDVSVTIRPLGEAVYGLSPYPFREDGLETFLEGRYLSPFPPDEEPDLAKVMRDAPVERQVAKFVAA